MRLLFALFIIVPVLEMWLLIKVGGLIGAAPTILLVLLTAMIGVALLRAQGFSTLLRARERMASNEIPAMEMIEGLILAVSGALLLTPGFATDLAGFCGLLPITRVPLARWLIGKLNIVSINEAMTQPGEQGVYRHTVIRDGDTTIDAEYWEEKNDK